MRDHLATLVDDFERYGAETAVVRYQGNRRRATSYGQIARLARRFAALLEDRKILPGDRVLIWAENSAEWIAAFHGCILRGAVAVPLDAYGSAEFAARVAADVGARLAVGDALLLRQLPAGLELVDFESWETTLPKRSASAAAGLNRDTALQILFTSGTTGDPKGIVHTHGNVLASIGPIEKGAQPYLRYEKYVHPLRFLHTLPLSHVFGQTMGLWIAPIFRAEVHFETRLVAQRLIETIRRERISVLAGVPRVFSLIKTHLESTFPELAEQAVQAQNIRAWKKWWRFRKVHGAFGFKFWALISGGGALQPPVEQFWNALGFVLVQGYGMTETTALITLNHPFHVARGTIGKPLPGREVKIGPDGEVLVRGPMISSATWQHGQLHVRGDEWLATGDLAEEQGTGELRFLGRKSEIIVTGSGINIHPEDLESAIEAQPGVAACAVVGVETASGNEPCAVLAMRLTEVSPGEVIEAANSRLAEFQRVRRWMLWPEPDLPRTSTGKVRRKAVAEWMAVQRRDRAGAATAKAPGADWLLNLVVQITGEAPPTGDDSLRLAEDLHLDSLGRVQLAAAVEQKLGMPPESGWFDQVETLGQLRKLVGGGHSSSESFVSPALTGVHSASALSPKAPFAPATVNVAPGYIYPLWPWSLPVRMVRAIFTEGIVQPLVWLLGNPRIVGHVSPAKTPMLIVANHVTAYDGPLLQHALPGPMRRNIAAAMSGEMLEDFRHFRTPGKGARRFLPFGPAAWFLLTALFNVFPLPRSRDFQRSFAHAGQALDRGFNVLVFPEGTRSADGELARFRPGIGLLVRQSNVPVLPVAIRGLGELKARGSGWFRSGKVEVRVGTPIRFAPQTSETEITEQLYAAVHKLLKD